MSDGNGENGSPLTPAGNGRGPGGKFTVGNKLGKGNPNNVRAQRLRNTAIKSVTRAKMQALMDSMLERAIAGDVGAAVFVRDTVLGRPQQADLLERIESVETTIADQIKELRKNVAELRAENARLREAA